MTFLIDRPVLAGRDGLADRSAHLQVLCRPHTHTARCWWNVRLGAWVCPPSGPGST